MDKKQAKIKSSLQPSPKVLVSCKGLNGENNALAVAYCCNCSYDPPMGEIISLFQSLEEK